MDVRRDWAAAIAGLAAASCAGTASAPSDALPRFMEEFFFAWAQRDPEWLGELRPFGSDVDPHGEVWTDVSLAARHDRIRFAASALAKLQGYDLARADPHTRRAAESLEWYLEDVVRSGPFLLSDHPLDPYAGDPMRLVRFLTEFHAIHSPLDVESYLQRLEALGPRIDALQDGLRAREVRGVIPPRPVLETLLADLDRLLAEPPESSLLVRSLELRSAELPDVAAERRRGWSESATREVAEGVQPSLRRLRRGVASLLAKAPEQAGVWRQSDGEAYYLYLVRHHTTLELDPAEIHARGLEEVARLQREFRGELAALGFEAPVFGDALRAYRESRGAVAPAPGTAAEPSLEADRASVAAAGRHFAPAQVPLPRGGLQVEPFPLGPEPAPMAYRPPSLDGRRPAVLLVDLKTSTPERRVWIYREAIPGRHVQLGLQREAEALPTFARLVDFAAFSGGWAGYAEGLAWKDELYPDGPGRIAALESELWRNAGAVVDTGIHHRRWWRRDALDWLRENLGDAPEAWVDRIIVRSGEALAAPVGAWHLREQRERVRGALGERFDLRRFHDAVLGNGGLPLPVLDRVVDDFVERER